MKKREKEKNEKSVSFASEKEREGMKRFKKELIGVIAGRVSINQLKKHENLEN